MRKRLKPQHGFSLLEMLIVVAVLTIVMGVVFTAISAVQKRYRTEEGRVDTMQNAREFVDQISRDMRNVGYPNNRMYAADQADTSINYAKGLAGVSKTEIVLEGDMGDISGTTPIVSSVRYQLQAGANGNCPCTLRRSGFNKSNGRPPIDQFTSFSAEVDNVVNSLGGDSAWTIAGTAPGGTANDTLYASYKTEPVFQYFDSTGAAVTVPDDLSSSNKAAGVAAAPSVALVLVTLNVLGPNPDLDSGLRPAATMRTTLKVPNR